MMWYFALNISTLAYRFFFQVKSLKTEIVPYFKYWYTYINLFNHIQDYSKSICLIRAQHK